MDCLDTPQLRAQYGIEIHDKERTWSVLEGGSASRNSGGPPLQPATHFDPDGVPHREDGTSPRSGNARYERRKDSQGDEDEDE